MYEIFGHFSLRTRETSWKCGAPLLSRIGHPVQFGVVGIGPDAFSRPAGARFLLSMRCRCRNFSVSNSRPENRPGCPPISSAISCKKATRLRAASGFPAPGPHSTPPLMRLMITPKLAAVLPHATSLLVRTPAVPASVGVRLYLKPLSPCEDRPEAL